MIKRRNYWIPVVAGFIKRDHQVLVGLRPQTDSLAGLWEFPGGKIEPGESPEEALIRELREELDVEAEVGELLLACTHTYEDVGILILFYEVKFWKGEPKTKHHTRLEWIKYQELRQREIPEANKKILDRILSALED